MTNKTDRKNGLKVLLYDNGFDDDDIECIMKCLEDSGLVGEEPSGDVSVSKEEVLRRFEQFITDENVFTGKKIVCVEFDILKSWLSEILDIPAVVREKEG